MKKSTQLFVFTLIWLVVLGGVFWWWQGRKETKEAELPEVLEESGQASLIETKPLQEKESKDPGEVVSTFYTYLNQEKYEEIEELLAPDYLEFVKSAGGFEKLWIRVPVSQKPAKVVIIDEKITGDTAEVWLTAYNSEGDKLEGEGMNPLRKINGEWKITMPRQ